MAGHTRLKVIETEVKMTRIDSMPGTVLDRDGHVACGEGSVLRLGIVQPESGKRMEISAAINGGYIQTGMVLV